MCVTCGVNMWWHCMLATRSDVHASNVHLHVMHWKGFATCDPGTSIRSALSCVGCIRLLFTSLSVGYVTFCKFLVYDGHILACHFVWYYILYSLLPWHGLQTAILGQMSCLLCCALAVSLSTRCSWIIFVSQLTSSSTVATALHGIIHEEFPVCVVCMCVCVRGHVCVPCAYTCLCICTVCGVARRGGLVCISVLLQSHGYIQYIARVVIMFTFGVGVGRERKKSWNYPYKNRSVSGSEKPLLVLPRRKSKKLELAHCPPKCELIHLNREWRDPNAPVARGSYLWMQMGTLVRTIGHVLSGLVFGITKREHVRGHLESRYVIRYPHVMRGREVATAQKCTCQYRSLT